MADTSIKEVARLAGVSIATVSRCINKPEKVTEQTRLKVASAIENTGYTPNLLAQRFRSGKTNQILVAVPSIGDPFFTKVMRGVRSAANALDYAIVIRETRQSMMSADEINATLESKQADGLVLLNNMTFVARQLDGANHPHLQPPAVQIDNAAAAREMTEYLIGQGHRHIGMICGRSSRAATDQRPCFVSAMNWQSVACTNSNLLA
jgi:LacI family repressor for deo operon, udp, cdd, tsx, nupC, and nupG